MPELPPPMDWLTGYVSSSSTALDSSIGFEITQAETPLQHKVRLRFVEPVSGRNQLLLWNLFQIWAAKNGAVPEGKVDLGPQGMVAFVSVKRRLGPKRNRHPLF